VADLVTASVAARGLSAREWRTIRLGLAVLAVAAATVWLVLPFARRWGAREALIESKAERLARVTALVAAEPALRSAVALRESRPVPVGQQLLQGRTPALAASALQTLVQGYADQSHVTVSQLDVAGAPDTTGGALPTIPATLTAVGDIHGVTELLSLLQHGARLLEVREVSVTANPSLRAPQPLLQLSVTLRAPYVSDAP
jgi:hypothetical protein